MPYCRPPDPYGKDWANDDWNALAQYEMTCPHAESSGQWEGAGRPETCPFQH